MSDDQEAQIAEEAAVEVAPEAVPEPEPAPAKPWDEEAESEARALGWKAPDEWKGEKPNGYIADPAEFLGRLEKIGPFRKLREARERDRQEFKEAQERNRQEFAARLEAIERVNKEAARREIDRVRAEQRKAVEHGDVERYEALRNAEDQLVRQREPQPSQPSPPHLPPEDMRVVAAWLQTKPESFGNDPEVNHLFFQELAHMPVPLRVVEIERRLRPAPTAPARPTAAKVDGGGVMRSPAASRDAFAALPPEAKQAFAKFVSQGLWQDTPEGRADYMKEYGNG